jgi:plastocyanin
MSAAVPGLHRTRTGPKLAALLVGAALAAAACAPAGNPPTFPVAQGGAFAVQVVDSTYDVGRSPSITVDSKGSPSVSYLEYQNLPKPGLLPVPVVAGTNQPPAVIVASLAGGVWKQSSVTPQPAFGQKAVGSAADLANDKDQAIPGVATSLAVDSAGKHHVAWSTPKGGVFYADDVTGTWSAPITVTKEQAFGVSIAVASDGTVWLSYYLGVSVIVAKKTGTSFTIERVAGIGGAPGLASVLTSIKVGSDGEPVVAFGDNGTTKAARRSGGTWTVETVGAGGFGVSLALDKDGNPYVASYETSGQVHAAVSQGGGGWQVQDVGTSGPGSEGEGDARWSTGIAVDQAGTEYVAWADTKANDIVLASGSGGSLKASPVEGSTGGTNPTLAVSADGRAAVAWFDSVNQNLDVATPSQGGLALAHSPAAPSVPPAPKATEACAPDGTALTIVAPAGASASGFDKTCLAVTAGQAFTVDFTNQDGATPHNFAIYTADPLATPGAKLLGGAPSSSDIVAGGSSQKYSVDALTAGTYFFHCDIHPTTMTGQFIVAKG